MESMKCLLLIIDDTIVIQKIQLKSITDGSSSFETTGYNNVTNAFKVSRGRTVSQSSGLPTFLHLELHFG
jgi:hypothetical protein